MDSDHHEGSADETGFNLAGSKIQETVTGALGDQAARADGLAGQVVQAGQNLYAEAKDHLRDAAEQVEQVKDYPLTSLLLAGVAGFIAGVFFRRA
jgi:uncharacterized protein YjbJ (UPF0337 family)